jgi:CHAD domain-containing protein
MEIERDSAERPLRKLRKALKRLPADPSTEDVHSLRTHTRKLEAIVAALMLESKRRTRNVLKAVRPVRKAAGDVRDMDVLVANVMALSPDGDDSLVRLVEHLGQMRVQSARGLYDTVTEKRKDARRILKQYAQLVEKQFPTKKPSLADASPAVTALATELSQWPALNSENIHPFRIKVKQLRYMLQLARTADGKMVDALGKVKDQVGDWHDWQELARIAKGVLNKKEDGPALNKIEEIGKKKFEQALATTNTVRKQYFGRNSVNHAKNGRPKAHATHSR